MHAVDKNSNKIRQKTANLAAFMRPQLCRTTFTLAYMNYISHLYLWLNMNSKMHAALILHLMHIICSSFCCIILEASNIYVELNGRKESAHSIEIHFVITISNKIPETLKDSQLLQRMHE